VLSFLGAVHWGAALCGPGAGGAIAGAQLYSKSAKDGTVIGALMPGAIMGRILDEKASTLFDPTKFVYIGTADSGTRVCITMANAPTKTYEDALRLRTIMAASQAGGATRDYEALHNHATGTKFDIVSGYKGTSDIMLAMERGEAAGLCGFDYSSLKSQKPDWLRDKAINILVQDGLEPEPELTAMGVPTIWPFIKNELDRSAVELVLSQQLFGRSYVLPPGASAEAVAILRKAFAATVVDPEFLADAARARVSISASSEANYLGTLWSTMVGIAGPVTNDSTVRVMLDTRLRQSCKEGAQHAT
jgi:hypothetical protein